MAQQTESNCCATNTSIHSEVIDWMCSKIKCITNQYIVEKKNQSKEYGWLKENIYKINDVGETEKIGILEFIYFCIFVLSKVLSKVV